MGATVRTRKTKNQRSMNVLIQILNQINRSFQINYSLNSLQ